MLDSLPNLTRGSGAAQRRDYPVHVLHLLDTNAFAGTEHYVLTLAREQINQGIGVTVACPAGSMLQRQCREQAIGTRDIARERLDVGFALSLGKPLREGQFDVVHAHNGRTALTAAAAVQLAGRGRSVLTQHFLQPAHTAHQGLKGAAFRSVHRWAHRRLHHTIAISEAVRDSALGRKDVPGGDITVVASGIFEPRIADLDPIARVRASLNIPLPVPLIVCVARLEPEKDVETLIAAMAYVVAERPDAHCIVAGEGSQRDILHNKIEQSYLPGRVHLLGYRTDALSLIQAGDLFVLPSHTEAFGLALLEAMALGKPVIATAAGGPLEIVVEGCTGRLVPPSHPRKLADAILALLNNESTRSAMGLEGRRRFQECFTAGQMARATLAVYQHVLAEDRSAPA